MPTYKSLKDYVYEYISHKIQIGELKPDEKISESSICEVLQVSRTPVREALIQLADEGILENLPRRGFTVKSIDINKVNEIYPIIGVLEGLAARTAIKYVTEKELDSLEYCIFKMDDYINNHDYENYYKKQLEFHQILIASCGNAELINLIEKLKKKFIKQSVNIDENREETFKALTITNNEHKKIFELVKSKKDEELEKFLKETHWNVTYARYETI